VRSLAIATLTATLMLAGASSAPAQVQMPSAKEMSGRVLPVPDVPVVTVTVKVVRGGTAQNIVGQVVELLVDGKTRTAKTGDDSRATFSGLAKGAKIKAVATVDGERLESQDAQIVESGLRIILVATDPEAAKREEEDRRLAAGPAVQGTVVLGPESRVIAEMSGDRLSFYYILEVVNSARTPVDLGGPLIFDLPREARGTTVLDDSTPKATANGARITVLGPFPPGVTKVQTAYELPYGGAVARLTQRWPVALQQMTVVVQQIGGLSLASPQLSATKDVTDDQGRALILGTGPGLAAGQALTLDISGLPHHAEWPRNLALALAGVIVAAGFWGAYGKTPRARVA
jgi:hypothetical protein